MIFEKEGDVSPMAAGSPLASTNKFLRPGNLPNGHVIRKGRAFFQWSSGKEEGVSGAAPRGCFGRTDGSGDAVKGCRVLGLLRVAPVWLAGYAGVILLATVLVNLATQLARNAYGLTLPSMEGSLGLSHFQAGSLITAMSILLMVAS